MIHGAVVEVNAEANQGEIRLVHKIQETIWPNLLNYISQHLDTVCPVIIPFKYSNLCSEFFRIRNMGAYKAIIMNCVVCAGILLLTCSRIQDSFVAPLPPPDAPAVDIDGNVYPAVVIGNQAWTTVNLRATRFNDGTAIPHVTDTGVWYGLTAPGYCFYKHTTDTNEQEKWGALYNWYAAGSGKLAPASGGWRVPTNTDWTALSDYLGGATAAGGKLKEADTTNWASPNLGATNESGFSALPGGIRSNDGIFYYRSAYGYWWSSSEYDSAFAWGRTLYSGSAYLIWNYDFRKQFGFSVRLVRDLH
jgi:uncharacterized protein (TIGR02145 family)